MLTAGKRKLLWLKQGVIPAKAGIGEIQTDVVYGNQTPPGAGRDHAGHCRNSKNIFPLTTWKYIPIIIS